MPLVTFVVYAPPFITRLKSLLNCDKVNSQRRLPNTLARMFHELLSRDHEDGRACPPSRACSLRRGGRATRSAGACAACRATVPRYRGIGSEAYLNGTSQGEPVLSEVEGTPEDARLPARRAYSSERRTAILFALAALRSVPQAGSQFRGRSHAKA